MNEYPKAARILGDERAQLAAELRAAYEDGSSIRVLAAECGRSYGSVHRLLVEAGAELRPRGGALRSERAESQ
jgi:predicted transcriptional regulator